MCDKLKANQDKDKTRQLLGLTQRKVHGLINQWNISMIISKAIQNIPEKVWIDSFVAVNLHVCVLTGLHNEQYDQITRWRSSNTQSGIAAVLDSAAYCYVIIPRHTCYSSTRRRDHTISSSHPGVNRLRPSISAYRTRSFDYTGVSRLCNNIPISHSATTPPYGSYCTNLSPNSLIRLASCETPAKVDRSCFSVAS